MQEQKYSIKQWAKDDRPREKLLLNGAHTLSDSELLAILILNGSKEKTAVDLAKAVLKLSKDNLSELGKLSVKDLMKVKGIGEAKAIADFFMAKLKDYRHEVFAVVFLNRANKINHFEIVSEGGITGTVADPRVILKKALEEDAVSIILCHNHPSGSLKPSRADEELTHKIKEAAKYFDIKVLDHMIVSDTGYFSFADEGLL